MIFFEYPMIYFGKALSPLALVSFLVYGAMQPDNLKICSSLCTDYLKYQLKDRFRFRK